MAVKKVDVAFDALARLMDYEERLLLDHSTGEQSDFVYTLVQTNSNNDVYVSDESIAFCVAQSFL